MKKILIIDDDVELLELLSLRLSSSEFEIVTARDRKEAIKAIGEGPDLVLLDIMMPCNGEGYEIYSELKFSEMARDVPVIFLSRKIEDREKALEIGGSYFIPKPYDGKELVEKIHLAIEGKRESLS